MNLTAKNEAEEKVRRWLEANATEALKRKIDADGRTLGEAMEDAEERARKKAEGREVIAVSDEEVYRWAEDFFANAKAAAKPAKAEEKANPGEQMELLAYE